MTPTEPVQVTVRRRGWGGAVKLTVAAVTMTAAVGSPRSDTGSVSAPVRLVAGEGSDTAASTPGSGPRQMSPVFVYAHGRYSAFDVPFGESAGDGVAINNHGRIVGGYADPTSDCLRGFLRHDRGRFTRVDVPAAKGGITQPIRINDRGQVVGDYAGPDGTVRGYLWDHGRVTTLEGPAGATGVTILDINDHGQLVGGYLDRAGTPHGFQLSDGVYTDIDLPGATFTLPWALNNRGQVAGFTTDALPVPEATDVHGFVLHRGVGGPVSRIDVPGAVIGTVALDIKDGGTVVGMYGNPNAAPSTRA
jgi:uncharacterized membrane protein